MRNWPMVKVFELPTLSEINLRIGVDSVLTPHPRQFRMSCGEREQSNVIYHFRLSFGCEIFVDGYH